MHDARKLIRRYVLQRHDSNGDGIRQRQFVEHSNDRRDGRDVGGCRTDENRIL